MKKHGIELVCFDLNKTLINEATWDTMNVALGMSPEEDQHYLDQFNAGKISYAEWTRILLDLYKQRGKASHAAISESVLKYNYKAGAKEIVAYLKGQGYHVALVSGAMDILVSHVAAELDIELAEANNTFVFDDAGNLAEISVAGEDDEAKVQHLQSFCGRLGIDITQCACVGDGDNDIKLFEATKHGITFEGSRIEHTAWKTIRELSDIKNIL